MKKTRYFLMVAIMIFSIILVSGGTVYGRSSYLNKNSTSNRYESTGAGPDTDHSYYSYYLDGEQVWCIEAGVKIKNYLNYSAGGTYDIPAAAYAMLSGRDTQLVQAAVWQIIGKEGINGSHVTNPDTELNNFVQECYNSTANQSVSSAWISASTDRFWYDRNTNTYRVDFSASAFPSTSYGWIQDNGWGNYTLIVDAATVGSDMNVTISLPSSGGRTVYDGIQVWVCGSYQKLATPITHWAEGGGASATFYLEAVGDLKVRKVDQHNNPVEGVEFTVNGPSGTNVIRTNSDGWAEWLGVKIGTYTIRETYVPANLVLEGSEHSGWVGSGTTQVWYYTQNNPYQRGSVTLEKYDEARRYFNMDKTLGDASLKDAVYELYAAEDIWEGRLLVHHAGKLIRGNIRTDENGKTEVISDLPVGRYYYVEVSASPGFDLNTNRVDVDVTYNGMTTAYASSKVFEAAEKPQWYKLEIKKKLKESDYDEKSNLSLHDTYHDYSGVQFKVTLNSDPTQVYYTHGSTVIGTKTGPDGSIINIYEELSGEDGLCLLENIPYGVYTIEEVKYPSIVAEPVASWEVDFRDDSPDVDSDRVARFTTEEEDIENKSKKVTIEVNKQLILADGEDTDAKVEGAYFTIYRDPECKDEANIVDVIGPTNREGYAKLNGYVWAGTYYMKETTFPEGIDPDSPVLKDDGTYEDVTYRDKIYVLNCEPENQTEELKTYSYYIKNVPKRNDIKIKKMIEGTSNTQRHEFENCIFTAYLKSSIGTDHEFSRVCSHPTDIAGETIIEDLPYGEYIVKETYCPDISMPCSDFTIFIELDRKEKQNPSWYEPTEGVFTDMTQVIDTETGAIVDPIKQMIIKLRKVDVNREEGDPADYTSGDSSLYGAVYSIYGLDPLTNDFTSFVGDITIDHQDEEGFWCAESEPLQAGSYKVIEKAKVNGTISYAEGYLVDGQEHYFYTVPEKQDKILVKVTSESKETPVENDIEITKEIGATTSTPIEKLEGAEFTAYLLSTDWIVNPFLDNFYKDTFLYSIGVK